MELAKVTVSQKIPGGKYVAYGTHSSVCQQSSAICKTKKNAFEYVKRMMLNYGISSSRFKFQYTYSGEEVPWESEEHEKEHWHKWMNG